MGTVPRMRPLTDGLVVLDEPRDDDAPAMLRAARDPMTRRPFGASLPSTADEAKHAIATARGLWAKPGELFDGRWVVRRAGSPGFAGWLRLHSEGAGVRVMAWFGPENRGQGLGTAAVRLACGFAVDELGAALVEAHITPDNGPSRSIVRGIGFAQRPAAGFTTSKDGSGMALVYQLPRGAWPPKDDATTESGMRGELREALRALDEHDANPDGDLPIVAPPGPRGALIRQYSYTQRRSEHEDRLERARQRIRRAGLSP
ncbi:MAG: GNAT family N-acetyltransferase [Chloroflexota bacterium]